MGVRRRCSFLLSSVGQQQLLQHLWTDTESLSKIIMLQQPSVLTCSVCWTTSFINKVLNLCNRIKLTVFPHWQIHSIINTVCLWQKSFQTTNKYNTSSVLSTDWMLFLFKITLTHHFPSQMSILTRNWSPPESLHGIAAFQLQLMAIGRVIPGFLAGQTATW